jgi:hypothetical protein
MATPCLAFQARVVFSIDRSASELAARPLPYPRLDGLSYSGEILNRKFNKLTDNRFTYIEPAVRLVSKQGVVMMLASGTAASAVHPFLQGTVRRDKRLRTVD